MSIFSNYVTVHRSVVVEALDWAKKNCPHYVTNDYNRYNDDKIDFFFIDNSQGRQEQMMFELKFA